MKLSNWDNQENFIQTQYIISANDGNYDIDELLGKKEISVPETFSIGCTIKWRVKVEKKK